MNTVTFLPQNSVTEEHDCSQEEMTRKSANSDLTPNPSSVSNSQEPHRSGLSHSVKISAPGRCSRERQRLAVPEGQFWSSSVRTHLTTAALCHCSCSHRKHVTVTEFSLMHGERKGLCHLLAGPPRTAPGLLPKARGGDQMWTRPGWGWGARASCPAGFSA